VTQITQTANIVVDKDLTPINAAQLTEYDGGNFTISGLDIESSDTYVGLFTDVCTVDDMTIKNLTLSGSMKSTTDAGYVGALAGSVGSEDISARRLTITNVDATHVSITGSKVWPESSAWPKHQSEAYAAARVKFGESVGRVLGSNHVTIDGFEIIVDGRPAIEKEALRETIADAEDELSKHEKTEEAQAALQTVINAAKEVLNNDNAPQEDIDKALDKLIEALDTYSGAALNTQSKDDKSKSSESKSKSSTSSDSDASKSSSSSASGEASSPESASTDSADVSGASEQSVETQSTDTSSNELSADEPSGEAMSTQSADTPGDENAPNADKE